MSIFHPPGSTSEKKKSRLGITERERERESVCVCEWDTERERVCVCEWVTERKRERVLALRGCRGLFLGSVRARFSPGIPLRRVLDLTEPEGLGFEDRLRGVTRKRSNPENQKTSLAFVLLRLGEPNFFSSTFSQFSHLVSNIRPDGAARIFLPSSATVGIRTVGRVAPTWKN